MSFGSILQTIVDECGGGVGVALMGSDGIPVEQAMAASDGASQLEEEFGAAGVEFGRILDEIRKVSDALNGGGLRETVVSLARFTLIFHTVDDEFFLVLALLPDGNLGKARYLIRRHMPAIRDEL
jgi:predicted regulator of Ras-like GTPase activity (Roadblock/LC7/MglB family)